MKTLKTIAVTVLGVLMLCPAAFAQQDEGAPARQRTRQRDGAANATRNRARAGRPQQNAQAMWEQMVKELKLTAEQQQQIKQLQETNRQAMQNLQNEGGDQATFRERMRKAMQDRDQEALAALRKEQTNRREKGQALQKELQEKIKAVLTDEQKELYTKMLAQRARPGGVITAARINQALRRARPTAEETEAIKKIMTDSEAAAKEAQGAEAKAAVWQKAADQIAKALGEEKGRTFLAALRQGQRPDPYAQLDLTADQQEKVQKIREEYMAKIREADRADRRDLFQKMREAINGVLTDEQKAKLRERPQGRQGRQGRQGQGRQGQGNGNAE